MIFSNSIDDRKVRGFSLSPTFLEAYQDQQPNWGYGGLGYFTYKRCVGIETPVLCDDLTWRPAGGLEEGQGIIGFEVEREGRKFRHLRRGVVMHNVVEKAETLGVELEDGTVLYATPDHPWLVKLSDTDNRMYWKQTKDLESTHKNGDVHLIRPFGPVWGVDDTYEGGFLSAAFDGEGCFDRMNSLSFIQVDNPMMGKVEGILDQRHIPYKRNVKGSPVEGRQQCFTLRVNGRRNFLPLLGSLRPPRLLGVFQRNLENLDGDLGAMWCGPEDYIKVKRVFPAGERDIAVLSTDLETHFTGGFASHNTYARRLPGGTFEEWWQTCRRVVEGVYNIQKIHCRQMGLPWNEPKGQRSAQQMFKRMWDFKFLPPGRGLWMMGTDLIYEKGSAALQNCGFASTQDIATDFAGPFCFLMDMSMLGVGVGGDTRGAGKILLRKPQLVHESFVVGDDREGWVDLIRMVLNSFTGKSRLNSTLDFRKVRARGEPIRGFGGVASGPGALKRLVGYLLFLLLPNGVDAEVIEKPDNVLRVALTGKGEAYPITSTHIVDIFNYIGKCVVAGGVRRSAEIMFGAPDDEAFRKLKQDKSALVERRWVSNNSIFADVGMDYAKVAKDIAVNGEPGLLWLDNVQQYSRMRGEPDGKDSRALGSNPCVEQSLEDRELCNLVETFPAHHDSYEDYQRTLKMAYLYAKTVTLVPTHDLRTNAVLMRNRRIGCSMSGIQQAMKKLGRRAYLNWCDQGYDYIQSLDTIYSEWLCVPRSVKTTSVKPSGTVSLLAGATPGIHYPHSKWYIRNVRVANTSPLVEAARKAGYPVEEDTYADDTMVVSFPVAEEHFTKGKADASIWEQFANASDMQRHWADNQVSCTVTFSAEEQGDIQTCLEVYEDRLKGISLLPLQDNGYKQAPYQEITEGQYLDMVSRLQPLNLSEARHEVTDKFCSNDTCEIPSQ